MYSCNASGQTKSTPIQFTILITHLQHVWIQKNFHGGVRGLFAKFHYVNLINFHGGGGGLNHIVKVGLFLFHTDSKNEHTNLI